MFEMLIARNCAPALAGIKPSNIVTCRKADFSDVHEEVARMNRELNLRGIFAEILFECEVSALIIVYRKSVLCAHLQKQSNRSFLARYGYGEASVLEEYIDILKSRLGCDKFPHEIGVFLGYPLRDIHCFIHHPKEGCIMVGDWRVYHNAEAASRTFCRFKACKRAVAQKVADGRTLAQIFCAS